MVLKAFAVVPRQCALAGFMFLSPAVLAQTPAEEPWNAKFQATYVWQSKQPFGALYSGAHSLSSAHRDYLAAGGLGFFLGDGQLNYAAEQIFESYYASGLMKQAWLTLDWQRIANPGYNAPARGTLILNGQYAVQTAILMQRGDARNGATK